MKSKYCVILERSYPKNSVDVFTFTNINDVKNKLRSLLDAGYHEDKVSVYKSVEFGYDKFLDFICDLMVEGEE